MLLEVREEQRYLLCLGSFGCEVKERVDKDDDIRASTSNFRERREEKFHVINLENLEDYI
jgi:hypothetical protein